MTPLKAHALHAQKGKFFRVHLLKQPAFKALIALWKTSLKRWIFSVLLIFLWFGIDHESRSDDVSSEPQKIHSSRMVLKSPSVTYHENSERMTAQGGASLYYKGRILKADTLTFDRLYKRFEAQGNVHLIETNGTSLWADQLQMTEDFSSGFVDGLNLETSDKTYFSSPRAERTGDILTFDKARYSACAPCKMGQRAPFWQLKATRIVHNKAEKMIYYENPQFEIFGIPILYAPYLSTADPTVRRKTGFLTPYYSQAPHLGFGVSLPFFINLAPHYDLTFTPSILTKQGVLGQLEWRQRLEHGQYMIRLSGISQQNTKVFLPPPLGPGNRQLRGAIQSIGLFLINPNWNLNWKVTGVTDKWFLDHYRIRGPVLDYLKKDLSTIHLTGQTERALFDLNGLYIRTLSAQDWQKQQPTVAPVLDYNRTFDTPSPMGGELSLRLNGTHSWRSAAAYLNLYGPNTLFQGYSGSCAVFVKGACLLTGMSGSYTRLSTEVGWQKTLVDSLGQQWTPFIRARAEVFGINPQINGYQNQYVANFMNPNSQGLGRFMPSLGMTYRIPFIASFKKSDVLHILEPIAQIVIRPNETHIRQIPNEDAQNVIFDDSSLFELDKFSGFDRVEGGTRANVGLRYGLTLPQTGYGEFLFGRSFQLAGRNSFSTPDLVNAGLQSGLDKKASDYVARLSLATQTSLLLTAQGRFDASTLKTQQMLFSTQAVFKRLTASFGVMQVATQQTQGDPLRWGLFSSLSLSLTSHISVGGTFLAGYNRQSDSTTSNPKYKWGTTGFMLNALYRDDCTTFGVAYAAKPTENRLSNGTFKPNHTFTLSLELRTLGSMSINPNFFSSKPPLMGIIP